MDSLALRRRRLLPLTKMAAYSALPPPLGRHQILDYLSLSGHCGQEMAPIPKVVGRIELGEQV